jgi:hypothetical protein
MKDDERMQEEERETKSTSKSSSSKRKEKSTFEEVMGSPVAKQVGKEIVRGVFGMLFGTPARRSTRRRSIF